MVGGCLLVAGCSSTSKSAIQTSEAATLDDKEALFNLEGNAFPYFNKPSSGFLSTTWARILTPDTVTINIDGTLYAVADNATVTIEDKAYMSNVSYSKSGDSEETSVYLLNSEDGGMQLTCYDIATNEQFNSNFKIIENPSLVNEQLIITGNIRFKQSNAIMKASNKSSVYYNLPFTISIPSSSGTKIYTGTFWLTYLYLNKMEASLYRSGGTLPMGKIYIKNELIKISTYNDKGELVPLDG